MPVIADTPEARLAALHALPAAAPVLEGLDGEDAVHVVGGAVRDLLLGHAPGELDLVVAGDAGAVARRAAARLGGTAVLHDRFGTATVRARGAAFDLATARTETYAQPGALPDVRLGATLAEDLARRDFTVNTLALHLADGALTGAPGALEDLDARVLRVLHDGSFLDDPTRLLRMARYVGRLRFRPEPGTAQLAAAAVRAGALDTVTGSRLGAELRRLLREPQPAAMVALAAHGVGVALLGHGWSARPAEVAAVLAELPVDARGELAALGVTLPAHADPGVLDRLAFPAADQAILLPMAAAHERAEALRAAATPSAAAHVLRGLPVEAVALLATAGGAAGAHARAWLDGRSEVRADVRGEDLLERGVSGPAVGRGLAAALDAKLDGRARTRDEQLAIALAAAGEG
jgi:tRNA nucleotidyltransferase (CCA-adding enzyme)